MSFNDKEFVFRAGLGLEAEDRLLIGAGRMRNEVGGILRERNERYYQFVVYRSVLSAWPAKLETLGNHDLVIGISPEGPLAVIEMKRWMSPTGRGEIPGIRRDVSKLKSAKARYRGLMIFSANPRGQTEKHVESLEGEVFVDGAALAREVYRFETIDDRGDNVEFWVSLWQVA